MSTTVTETLTTISYYDGPSPTDATSRYTVGSIDKCTNNQIVSITDIRPTLSQPTPTFTLDKNGFTVLESPSALNSAPYTRESWNDQDLREQILYPELEALAKKVTGCKKVMVFSGQARSAPFKEPETERWEPSAQTPGRYPSFTDNRPRVHGFVKGQEGTPAKRPHIDWGAMGARATLRNWRQDIADEAKDIIEEENAIENLPGGIPQNYKGRRWAIYGTWRPLKPIKRDPLGIVDYQTVKQEELVSHVLEPPGINGTYKMDVMLSRAPADGCHRWYWVSDMQPEELIFLKFFDTASEKEGSEIAGGTPHCSFQLEGRETEPPRESLEVRMICFW